MTVSLNLPDGAPAQADVLKQAQVFTAETVHQAWQACPLSALALITTDGQYRALPKSLWQTLLTTALAFHHEYQLDFFDCDKFSLVFKALVVLEYEVNGVAQVFDNAGKHSYNAVLITDDKANASWHRIEPQADAFLSSMNLTDKLRADYPATSGFAIA